MSLADPEETYKAPWYEQLVTDCSKIYEYETGFYFYGKKTYTINNLGYCTVFSVFFMFVSIIVIISPLISGKTVISELKSYAIDTPAEIPLKNDVILSSFAQFFGRKTSRKPPLLDIEKFLEQFHQIEIYGPSECNQAYGLPIMSCLASNL